MKFYKLSEMVQDQSKLNMIESALNLCFVNHSEELRFEKVVGASVQSSRINYVTAIGIDNHRSVEIGLLSSLLESDNEFSNIYVRLIVNGYVQMESVTVFSLSAIGHQNKDLITSALEYKKPVPVSACLVTELKGAA